MDRHLFGPHIINFTIPFTNWNNARRDIADIVAAHAATLGYVLDDNDVWVPEHRRG